MSARYTVVRTTRSKPLPAASTPQAEFLAKMVLTIPALSIAIFSAPVGWLIDRTGRKTVLISAIFLYALAGTSGLYLDSLHAILASRASGQSVIKERIERYLAL